MSLGAPWVREPDWWSLDSIPMRVTVPATTSFVGAICTPGDAAGLWTCFALTDPLWHQPLVEAIYFRRAPLLVFDRAADVLVEKITGWHRWEAAFVWTRTLGAWTLVDGDLTTAGVDLTALPPGRATNTAFAWWREHLGRDEQAWKKFLRDMQREPRRIIEQEADKPMDPAVFGELGAIGAKNRARRDVVPTSTITMPEPD